MSTSSAKPSTPFPTDTPSPKWYHTIAQLPLSKFIDVAVDQNLSALIISGFPSTDDLAITWEEIKTEYGDAVGDNESRLYNSLFKEINILAITLQQIHMLVEILEKIYYEPLASKLNVLVGTSFQFDPEKGPEYHKYLKSCLNRSKAIKIDLDLKTIHFKAIEERQSQGPRGIYTREYFQSILITISDHAKYPVTDSITVFEFCERMKRFAAYCEQVNKMNKR